MINKLFYLFAIFFISFCGCSKEVVSENSIKEDKEWSICAKGTIKKFYIHELPAKYIIVFESDKIVICDWILDPEKIEEGQSGMLYVKIYGFRTPNSPYKRHIWKIDDQVLPLEENKF